MKDISKLIMLLVAALAGAFALFMGNDPTGLFDDENNNNNNTYVEPKDKPKPKPKPQNDLPKGNLNYIPTQAIGDEQINHTYFSVSYSSKHQNPEWVAYELTNKRLSNSAEERRSFKDDPETESDAKSDVYSETGYDRGHLAPAHDMAFNETAMEECFYMTNISPQDPDFNRGIWKSLETKVRHWAETEKRLYIVTGPILRKKVSSRDRMVEGGPTVPSKFYKIILDYEGSERKAIAFVLENKASKKSLTTYAVSIDEVEELTGLDFFPDLSAKEEKALEATFDVDLWEF